MTDAMNQPVRRGRKPKTPLLNPQDAAPSPVKSRSITSHVKESFPPPTEISERLFEQNMKLACARARRAAGQTRLPYDTLLTPAYIGLLRACRKYNPELINERTGQPYHLSSLAVRYIDGEIGHLLRKNHTSGVKFPDRWRDNAPKIRRLIGQGLTPEDVARETGFTADEVREIIEAQSATHEIKLDQRAYYDPELEFSDDELECPEYIKALEVLDTAWLALGHGDQSIMIKAWDGFGVKSTRRELALRPYGQWARYAIATARGHDLPRGVRQPMLNLVVNSDSGDTEQVEPKTITGSADIIDHIEQQVLGLKVEM